MDKVKDVCDRNSTPTLDRSQVVRVGDGGARFERRRTAARRRGSSRERDRDARGERVVAAVRFLGSPGSLKEAEQLGLLLLNFHKVSYSLYIMSSLLKIETDPGPRPAHAVPS
jgi:hypothetical protein